VFVHGFTQTSESWKPIAEHFAESGYVSVIVDAPGHGESGDVHADLYKAATLAVNQFGRAVYIGYSMGGRLCLHAAAMHGRQVVGLAMIGASPGIADEGDRTSRRAADERLAERIEQIGVDAFLDEWLAQPLFAGLTITKTQRADRLRNTAEGLAASLRLAGTGAQVSMWPQLGEMPMPVLTVAGELDQRFTTIGQKVASAASAGRFEPIPGVGHAAHLQAPDAVTGVLERWLRDVPW
jgi:2-succinyl-6-hydroxy-2,4-cyclohexadiene-1-carboxylate synthase